MTINKASSQRDSMAKVVLLGLIVAFMALHTSAFAEDQDSENIQFNKLSVYVYSFVVDRRATLYMFAANEHGDIKYMRATVCENFNQINSELATDIVKVGDNPRGIGLNIINDNGIIKVAAHETTLGCHVTFYGKNGILSSLENIPAGIYEAGKEDPAISAKPGLAGADNALGSAYTAFFSVSGEDCLLAIPFQPGKTELLDKIMMGPDYLRELWKSGVISKGP